MQTKMLINGERIEGTGGVLEVLNPINGSNLSFYAPHAIKAISL